MNNAVIPSYEFTVAIPGFEFDKTIPSFSFAYILPALGRVTCDNTYMTVDNLITVDNG